MSGFLRTYSAICAAACCLCVSACGGRAQRLTVGAKNSVEQTILGEILAQHLARRFGADSVARRFGLASTLMAHEALMSGEVDVYPEYSGTALAGILKIQPDGAREAVREQMKESYRTRWKCEWFGPLGFENGFALVVRNKTAAEEKIRTLSDASNYEPGWNLLIQQEFQDRADGLPLLMGNYRLKLSAPLRNADTAAMYAQLEQGKASMVAANTTDAELNSGSFTVLEDDKRAFPPYEAGFVARAATLERIPGLAEALRSFQGRISAERMKAMNRQAALERLAPEVVAARYLKESGL